MCGPLTQLIASRDRWDAGAPRLERLYGIDPRRMSSTGREAWRTLANKAGNQIEVGVEICSPKRKALRARLAPKDQAVMRFLCPQLINTHAFFLIQFILVSDRRLPDAGEREDLRIINEALATNAPGLAEAVRRASL